MYPLLEIPKQIHEIENANAKVADDTSEISKNLIYLEQVSK